MPVNETDYHATCFILSTHNSAVLLCFFLSTHTLQSCRASYRTFCTTHSHSTVHAVHTHPAMPPCFMPHFPQYTNASCSHSLQFSSASCLTVSGFTPPCSTAVPHTSPSRSSPPPVLDRKRQRQRQRQKLRQQHREPDSRPVGGSTVGVGVGVGVGLGLGVGVKWEENGESPLR